MYGLVDDGAPVYGEHGIYGEYVYPEEYGLADEDYFDEQWAPIDSNGDYMVSTNGRVWSTKTQRFLKLRHLGSPGHLGVCLSYNNKPHYRYIHRLMAEAFIENRNNDPIVRHLNDDPSYNFLENLACGTMKDNARDCIENGHAYRFTDEDLRKGRFPRMIPVRATNIETGEYRDYENLYDACRDLCIQQPNAWKALHGERRHAGGYTFKALEKDISDE